MRIAVSVLGAFEVRVESHLIDASQWRLRHPRQVLQMVAIEPAGSVRRELVVSSLWPHLSAEAGANRLHHTLHLLRTLFVRAGMPKDEPVVRLDAGVLTLGKAHAFDIDVNAFRARVQEARSRHEPSEQCASLMAVLDLYRGELLNGSPCEDWLAPHREALRLDYLWALERLAVLRRRAGEPDAAIVLYRKVADTEPANELAHRALMELFDETGHPERAIHQYAVCKRTLQRELDVEPSPVTRELLQRIVGRAGERRAQLAEEAARPKRYEAPAHAMQLLGRDEELDLICRWLTTDGVRLATITASAGMGKTHLAQAVAQRCQAQFEHGVVALELTGVQDAAQLVAQLGAALGLERADEQSIAGHLAQRQTLLLLDRFEHLLSATALLTQWMAAAPRLHVLVTSQSALRCIAERVLELTGLVGAQAAQAVRLFAACASRGGVHIDDRPSRVQADAICRRLGGNPLAIQLAACQASRLPLTQLLRALDRPLDLLENTAFEASAPQRSLREAIAWSCALLEPRDQQVFAMLGVFAERFTLADAQAVLASFFGAEEVREGAHQLINWHLLTRRVANKGSQAETRLVLLDAPRQFALDLARQAPWYGALVVAHAAHVASGCAQLYEHKVEPHRIAPPAVPVFEALLPEVRMIFNPGYPLADTGLRQAIAFHAGSLHMFSSAIAEALGWLRQAAALEPPDNPVGLLNCAKVHFALATAHRMLGEFSAAVLCLRQARRLASRAEPNSQFARLVTARLAGLRSQQGRTALARRQLQQLVRDAAPDTPPSDLSRDLYLLAMLQSLFGEFAAAIENAQRSYDLALQSGDMRATMAGLYTVGQVLLSMGHTEQARETHDECMVMLEQGFPFSFTFMMRLSDVIIDIESCAFESAAAKLPGLEALVEPMRGKRLWRAVNSVADWLRIERGQWDGLVFIDTPAADEMDFEADFAELFIVVQCLRMRVFSRRGQWDRVADGLHKLEQCSSRHGGALWQGWIRAACCEVALLRARTEAADELLQQAQGCFDSPALRPSPRVQRDLAALRARLPRARRAARERASRRSALGDRPAQECHALMSAVLDDAAGADLAHAEA
jgi:DNA-binding SARP family transcriptional activator/predicted ATPase